MRNILGYFSLLWSNFFENPYFWLIFWVNQNGKTRFFQFFFSKIFLWFPHYIVSTCAILKILGLFMYPFVVKNSMCTVLQKWGHANHRTPATPSTTKHTHAFYNGMCMYRSYRMVQRNFNFLCIFRKLTIDLISPLPISSYVFLL